MNLTRREALRLFTGAAALSTAVPFLKAAENESIKHSACRWCYPKINLEDLVIGAKAIGLSSIELLDPSDWPIVQKHGLTCAMANGATKITDGFNRIENHSKYVPGMIDRIKACSEAGIPNVICFSGNRRGMADEQGLENCVIGIKQITAAAEKYKVTVCMELLNSKVNHKDYMCDHSSWGVELVKRVGSERFKLLYDIYHMQIMEGDVIHTIKTCSEYFGHYHTGGVPGRHEIDNTQELNYPAIMRAIKETGYKGFVGQEFIPAKEPFSSLRQAVETCTV
jgi:hydroxypyruvate isomerase